MDELTKLGQHHGTDKAEGRMYTQKVYYPLMEHLKNEKVNILELGVGDKGASHKMWRDFFPNGKITLFDPFFITAPSITATAEEMRDLNIKVVEGNQLDPDALSLLDPGQEKYDFIIDDASHMNDAAQISLGYLFPYLKSGGYYIIEDLVCAHDRGRRIDDVNRWLDGDDVDQKKKKFYHNMDVHVGVSAYFAEKNHRLDWPSRYMTPAQKRYLLENISSLQFAVDSSPEKQIFDPRFLQAEILIITKK